MTLEHLSDPIEFVEASYRLLEPGGMLAVIVHNSQAPINRLLSLHSPIIDIEHLQLFNPRSIYYLLRKGGFVSILHQSISNTYPLGYWLRLTPLPIKLKTSLAEVLNRLNLLKKQISLPVGNMLAIGMKPVE